MTPPFGNFMRLLRTVRHLKYGQLYHRARRKIVRPSLDLSSAPPRARPGRDWVDPARRHPSMLGPRTFRFLNRSGDLDEIGWDAPGESHLWQYNLHYFDDLVAENAEDRWHWHGALIGDWIARVESGRKPGWEPYPTSLRIVNWIKWALAGHALGDRALDSLAVQARWLSANLERHLLGNHLFVNAKALIFAGLFFTSEEAEAWLKMGLTVLKREIPEQILPDGGQFELSPMYHALAIEDLLDLVNLARAFSRSDLAEFFSAPLSRMLSWLAIMSHPDGRIAFFNDAAFGIAPSNQQLFDYAERLGVGASDAGLAFAHLPDSGYVRCERGSAVMIVDVGRVGPDYIPGHAHADTLSFELSLHGRRLFVNGGTSTYGISAQRGRERSTAAHNALVVDGKSSSEVWSGFRVGRRARPFGVKVTDVGAATRVEGAHDGYRHLPGSPIHHRSWHLTAERLTITDRVSGSGRHLLELVLHLHPDIVATFAGSHKILFEHRHLGWKADMEVSGLAYRIDASEWHPEFGECVASQSVSWRSMVDLPFTNILELGWNNL